MLGQGPYLVCDQTGPPQPVDDGVEPGTVSFATTLGRFASGEQRIDIACAGPLPSTTAFIVPAAGQAAAWPRTCRSVAVRLTPAGQAGDAVISVRYVGAFSGAFSTGGGHVTVTPQATTFVLSGGCNTVRAPSSLPAGSPVSLVVELVDPPTAVSALWRHDPATGRWQAGYLREMDAPLEFDTVDPGDALTICVDALARFPLF
jgi:hypothetical protein